MTKCIMTGKEIKCPECGSKLVAIHYDIDYTHFYCQNMARDPLKQCNSTGLYCFKSYSHFDPKYPEIIRKDIWMNGGEKGESIEFTPENFRKKEMERQKERDKVMKEDNRRRLNKHLAEDPEEEEIDTDHIDEDE